MRTFFVSLLLVSVFLVSRAQNNLYLYNNQNPFLLSPALTVSDSILHLTFSNQIRTSESGNIPNTSILGFSTPVSFLHGGVGLIVSDTRYDQFNLSYIKVSGIYSFRKRINNNFSFAAAIMPGLFVTHYSNLTTDRDRKNTYEPDFSFSAAVKWKKLTSGVNVYNLFTLNNTPTQYKVFTAWNLAPVNGFGDNKLHFSPMLSMVRFGSDWNAMASLDLHYKYFQFGADILSNDYLNNIETYYLHAGISLGNLNLNYRFCPDYYKSTLHEFGLSYRFGTK
ncbi:hypothetical protein SDC9_51527 [bioreactor metagenome]|uniref:Type IX secretion system membrane protein PorP/SprF n=1 Tax=bioreactor metagenome TaxID=1076179 RepID=A0A644WNM3_9ZZZZ